MTVNRSPIPETTPPLHSLRLGSDLATPYQAIVIKEELCTRIEKLLTHDGRTVVRKVYNNRPFLLWRTFLQSSRAAREFCNLARVHAAGVPCIQPISWSETRMYGFLPQSELVSEFAPNTATLKALLARPCNGRRVLVVKTGQLLRQLHQAGFASFRFVPRNVLIKGTPPACSALVCDLPYAVRFNGSIVGKGVAALDLYDIAFSAQRQRDLSKTERLRLIIAYTDGNRSIAGALWRKLSARGQRKHRTIREWSSAWYTYVLPPLSGMFRGHLYLRSKDNPAPIIPLEEAARSHEQDPLAPGKAINYESARGAAAYKADHERKVHRRLSTNLEKKIFDRFFAGQPKCDTLLDLPSGNGRLFPVLREQSTHVIEADFSTSMLRLNRTDHDGAAQGYMRCSALEIPLPDLSVDTTVSIRLSHHLETEADRERHLRELFRITRNRVIVSYFSHHSLKNTIRRVRAPFNKKPPKNTLRTSQVRELANECGFRIIDTVPLSRLASGHIFALLERTK